MPTPLGCSGENDFLYVLAKTFPPQYLMRKPQGWDTHCSDQAGEGVGRGGDCGEGILENYFDI